MRILADENFPGDVVEALRKRGHDVVWIRTDAPGSTDRRILARAQAEGRLIVTFDKDFGELAFRSRLPASCGVLLLRVRTPLTAQAAHAVVAILESPTTWTGHFAVIEPGRVRLTALPGVPE